METRKFNFFFIILVVSLAIFSCKRKTANIVNKKEGQLVATMELTEVIEKKILLDSITAPKPQYTQMYIDSVGNRLFTFLNIYANAIYFYNYDSLNFIKKITYDKKGPDGILSPMGYYIKNVDSIYVYDMRYSNINITNSKGRILNKVSLRGKENSRMWFVSYPQYIPKTVVPFIMTDDNLLLTGQIMRTVPDSLVNKFKLTSKLNLKTNEVDFVNTYPESLYGSNYNWEGEIFTEVFPELHPDGDKLILSFPVSHDLYIKNIDSSEYIKVYAGSNYVESIRSLNKPANRASREELVLQVIEQNEYAAILYDKYREVYYRFLLQNIPDANINTQWKEKPVVVIMMDRGFNYLGETTLGTWREWNWHNSFVTEEGLNIEYLDNDDIDEVALTLKIFTPKKISQ